MRVGFLLWSARPIRFDTTCRVYLWLFSFRFFRSLARSSYFAFSDCNSWLSFSIPPPVVDTITFYSFARALSFNLALFLALSLYLNIFNRLVHTYFVFFPSYNTFLLFKSQNLNTKRTRSRSRNST